MARDPGQAGIAQQEFYVRLLNGYILDFSPETGDKQTRAKPFAIQCNNFNVEMIRGDWNASFTEELRAFPNGRHDDQVDASSRAYMVLTSKSARMPMNISDEALALAGGGGPDRLARQMAAVDALQRGEIPTENLAAWGRD